MRQGVGAAKLLHTASACVGRPVTAEQVVTCERIEQQHRTCIAVVLQTDIEYRHRETLVLDEPMRLAWTALTQEPRVRCMDSAIEVRHQVWCT